MVHVSSALVIGLCITLLEEIHKQKYCKRLHTKFHFSVHLRKENLKNVTSQSVLSSTEHCVYRTDMPGIL